MAAQVDFADLFEHLKDQAVTLASISLEQYENEAKKGALLFLNEIKEKLARWTLLLADHQLTTDDFEWLVNSQKQLMEMHALNQAGLTTIRVEQFKNSVLNMVVDTVFSFVKI
ncbi:MAG: hypothetical protein LH478_10905 [Chitinophagaceae bacterium]|nr:hypothetical protein [Chitinophagaceae bacterium]